VWWRGLLACGVVAGCTTAHHLSTAAPDRGGLELRWEQPIATPEGTDAAPWLAVGPTAAFVAGPTVGLMAFDLTGGGALLWSSAHVSTRPPVSAGDVIVTVADDELIAIRQDRDEVAWRTKLDAAPHSLFAIGDRIGVTSGQDLRTFDVHGAPGWRLALGASPATPLVFDSGTTFVALEDLSLIAIDNATGAIQWRSRLAAAPESLASAGTRVYLSAANGHLDSFEKSGNPKPKWDYAKIRAIGQPVIDARSVYFSLLNNILYAFTQGGGSERWHTSLPDRPVTGPLLLHDTLAIPLADGRVIEVGRDGHIRKPAVAPSLPASLALQSAVATADRTGVVTVTTAQDQKRILMAWGPPKN
jgi:outer membrane protein assembly factor BamB